MPAISSGDLVRIRPRKDASSRIQQLRGQIVKVIWVGVELVRVEGSNLALFFDEVELVYAY